MIANCQHCGAPLDLKPSARTAKCNYCNRVNQVRSMETVLPQTPPNWQPPPVWTPPPQFQFQQASLQYHRTSNRAPLLIMLVVGAGVALTGLSAGVFALLGAGASSVRVTPTSTPPLPGLPVDTSGGVAATLNGRFVCTGGNKTVSNQVLEGVVASGHCTVTLSSCTIGGNPAVVANGHAKVIVNGGSIRPAGPIAVVASGNAVVELRGAKLAGQVLETGNARVVR